MAWGRDVCRLSNFIDGEVVRGSVFRLSILSGFRILLRPGKVPHFVCEDVPTFLTRSFIRGACSLFLMILTLRRGIQLAPWYKVHQA